MDDSNPNKQKMNELRNAINKISVLHLISDNSGHQPTSQANSLQESSNSSSQRTFNPSNTLSHLDVNLPEHEPPQPIPVNLPIHESSEPFCRMYESRTGSIECDMATLQSDNKKLCAKLKTNLGHLADYQQRVQSLESTLCQMESENKKLSSQLMVASMTSQVSGELQARVRELEAENRDKQRMVEEVKSQRVDDQRKHQQMRSQMQRQIVEISDKYRNESNQYKEETQRLHGECAEVKRHHDAMKEELVSAVKAVDTLMKENASILATLDAERKKQIEGMQKDLASMSGMRERIATLEREKKDIVAQNERNTNEVASLQKLYGNVFDERESEKIRCRPWESKVKQLFPIKQGENVGIPVVGGVRGGYAPMSEMQSQFKKYKEIGKLLQLPIKQQGNASKSNVLPHSKMGIEMKKRDEPSEYQGNASKNKIPHSETGVGIKEKENVENKENVGEKDREILRESYDLLDKKYNDALEYLKKILETGERSRVLLKR